PAEMVTGNNRLITFDTADVDVRVFAPTFDAGYRTLPAPPMGTLWNTAADGTGAWFTDTSSTADTGTTNLYAALRAALQVSSDPADLTVTAGESYTFPVTVTDETGAPLSPQPTITYASPDCV